jgi:hypothetical protein
VKQPVTPQVKNKSQNQPTTTPNRANGNKRSATDAELLSPQFATLKKLMLEQHANMMTKISDVDCKLDEVMCDVHAVKNDLQCVKDDVHCVREEMQLEISAVRDELTRRIDKIDKKHSTQIGQLNGEVVANREMIDRIPRLNSLSLGNIPHMENENLPDYFARICGMLGVTPVPFVNLKRFTLKSGNTQGVVTSEEESPNSDMAMQVDETVKYAKSILIQFVFKTDRDSFFRAYITQVSTIKLILRDIGIDSDDRIYVNECLTRYNAQLKKEAIKLKDRGGLHKVSTKDGGVYIQRRPGAKKELLSSMEQLEG